jgi:hypothetical protein
MNAYQGNLVLDASDHHNNANLLGNVVKHSGRVSFEGLDAQLEVPVRDESLGRFEGLRIQALFKPASITRRFNLVEGWMSFALVIRDDARLSGTIYDGHNWNEVNSGAATVPPNQWSRVSFEYDGVSIASLQLNGVIVGSRFDMPAGIRQPQQVIALGHWPRGDGRYTFAGDLGHVRIEKRDLEDYARDAMMNAFCRRRLSPEQAIALRELRFLIRSMSPHERDRLLACAKAKSDRTRHFLHKLRSWDMREVARLRQLGKRLLSSWCCTFDAPEVIAALREYFRDIAGASGSPERARFHAALDEFFEIAFMCSWPGQPYQRMRELGAIFFPELDSFEADLRAIADSL